jgi:glycerophosphoryl diester phosphodiesterase
LIRASVSLGEASPLCGCSTVITPRGEELVNMKSRVGLGICEIDPSRKYYKPAGYGGELRSHHEYVEEGRRPWRNRNGGASVVLFDGVMPYPRLCAHRGFSAAMPENSLPSLATAISLGAQEVEFDLRTSSDGVLVSIHDPRLERVSNGRGKVEEHTFAELRALDFSADHPRYHGLTIPTFEEILQKFAGRVIMNIHVKIWEGDAPTDHMDEIVALVKRYDCERHVYFMTTNDEMLRKAMAYAPDIAVCVGWDGNKAPLSIVERAIALGAKKVQLFKPYFNEETVKKAHAHGILCNVFWADDPAEACRYFEMGIDTVLTNDYLAVYNAVKKYLKYPTTPETGRDFDGNDE